MTTTTTTTTTMELTKDDLQALDVRTEEELIRELLLPEDTTGVLQWIDLGCGAAKATESLARDFPDKLFIKAFDVDQIQNAKNFASKTKPDNLTFDVGGMQDFANAIEDSSVDAVIMLKSLHHVPFEGLKQGFEQIHRVLKPGGKLFVSEPVLSGDYNDILKLFQKGYNHQEGVRASAFGVLQQQVSERKFNLGREIHFTQRVDFPNGFTDFEEKVLKCKHTHHPQHDHHQHHHNDHDHSHDHHHANHAIDNDTLTRVKEAFAKHVQDDGSATFFDPMRVDLLVKP